MVRPIKDLSGHEHFNEVTFDNVRLDADALIGVEGDGWAQATSELAFERSGPERFLSAMTLFSCLVGAIGPTPNALQAMEIGRLAAWLISLRSSDPPPYVSRACKRSEGGGGGGAIAELPCQHNFQTNSRFNSVFSLL
jgi:hypothetical protein